MIDPLAPFLRSESQSRSILETLLPLGALFRTAWFWAMQEQFYERLRQNTTTSLPELEAFWQAAAQQGQERVDRMRKPIAQIVPEQWMLLVMCQEEKHQLELLARFQGEGLECKVLLE